MSQPTHIEAMIETFRARKAHAFLFHQNIRDYVPGQDGEPKGRLTEFLTAFFSKRDVVVIYDRATGLQFPIAGHRERFVALVNPKPAVNAALAQALGQQVDPGELPTDPAGALPLLDRLLRIDTIKAAVIVDYAEFLIPAADFAALPPTERQTLLTLIKWGSDRKIASTQNVIVMLAEQNVALHPALRNASTGWFTIDTPLPTSAEREAFARWYLLDTRFATNLLPAEIANACAGLNLVQMEEVFLTANLAGKLTFETIKARKREIISAEYGDVLEFLETDFGWERIGGLAHIKSFFQRSVIDPIHKNNLGRVPMGILMTGAAGTGKTVVARAVAKECGISAVRLQIGGKIASMWQGQGERNLAKAIQAIKGFSPCIVFIDEIDQTVKRDTGAGGSQQDARIFEMLMEFMSNTDLRGRVVVLAATNRPDLMDAALLRPGRFDKKIAFPIPGPTERREILRVALWHYCGDAETPITDEVIERTDGWTGAELEALAVKTYELMEDERWGLTVALQAASERLSPSTADIAFMTDLALKACNDLDLLPPEYRDRLLAARQAEKAAQAQVTAPINRKTDEVREL